MLGFLLVFLERIGLPCFALGLKASLVGISEKSAIVFLLL